MNKIRYFKIYFNTFQNILQLHHSVAEYFKTHNRSSSCLLFFIYSFLIDLYKPILSSHIMIIQLRINHNVWIFLFHLIIIIIHLIVLRIVVAVIGSEAIIIDFRIIHSG